MFEMREEWENETSWNGEKGEAQCEITMDRKEMMYGYRI